MRTSTPSRTVRKPAWTSKPAKLVSGITEHERRAHHSGCRRANVPFESCRERREAWAVSKCSPDQHYEAPSRFEDAIHFARSLLTIGKVLKSKLAEDSVEARGNKGQCSSVAFPPFHCGASGQRRGTRTGEHSRVEVNTDHVTASAHLFSGQTCNHTRPTCHVEHSLAGAQRCFGHEESAHGSKIAGTSSVSYTSAAMPPTASLDLSDRRLIDFHPPSPTSLSLFSFTAYTWRILARRFYEKSSPCPPASTTECFRCSAGHHRTTCRCVDRSSIPRRVARCRTGSDPDRQF